MQSMVTMLGYETAYEVVEDFMKLFPLMVVNKDGRLVYFSFKDVRDNKADAYDWSDGFVRVYSVEFGNDNLASLNHVRYAISDGYKGLRADGSFTAKGAKAEQGDYAQLSKLTSYEDSKNMRFKPTPNSTVNSTIPVYPLAEVEYDKESDTYAVAGTKDMPCLLFQLSSVQIYNAKGEDGKTYNTTFYNLDAIISVGYRVNSLRATQFRQWCTYVLRQFAIRGYVIDKKRMENGSFIGEDYFEHLLAEIREIRLSERRFYQKLTDIYATSIDYNKSAPTTRLFYKKVQNKMHYAVHGHTAAELIVERADASKEHMGLTTWENAPDGKIVKPDVSIAKNYLKQTELEDMGRLVNAVLDMAERMAKRHIPMTMEDWAKRIDLLLEAGGDAVLDNAGRITAEFAKQFAEAEFEKYRVIQDKNFSSDFDRFIDNTSLPLDLPTEDE